MFTAALRERQTKDLAYARSKLEKIDKTMQQKNQREKAIRDAVVIMPCNEAERNPDRLFSNTKASEYNSLTYEHLDEAEQRRRSSGAHDSNVALSGRDLQYGGRAIPSWLNHAK